MGIKWSMKVDTLDSTRMVAAVENSDATALEEFIHVLRNVEVAKYTLVATFMLFVYDLMLTFDEEILLVWPSHFGVPKALFFLNRYFPFVDLGLLVYVLMVGSDPLLCVEMFQVLGGYVAFGFVIAQVILGMRTWAIWGRRKSVTILLVAMLIVALGMDVYVLHRYLSGISYSPLGPFEPAFQGCPLHFANRFVFVDFALVMIIESITLTLLVVKALEHFKHSRSTLMVRMFKDGIIYFIFILITSIANLVVIISAPFELHNFLIITQRILHSIFCSRVLLHIRGAYTNTPFESTTTADSQHIQTGAHYSFRRPVSSTDAPRDSDRHSRIGVGVGRLGRRELESFEIELTSVDHHVHHYGDDDAMSPSGDVYEVPVLKGWGKGDGYDGSTRLETRSGSRSGRDAGEGYYRPRGTLKDLPEAY